MVDIAVDVCGSSGGFPLTVHRSSTGHPRLIHRESTWLFPFQPTGHHPYLSAWVQCRGADPGRWFHRPGTAVPGRLLGWVEIRPTWSPRHGAPSIDRPDRPAPGAPVQGRKGRPDDR
ncbi:MAG: hypothetical protein EBZ89_07205 [Chloroflexi bacterium]|nr:hypothetical protein [Chloroflexota bacterium]